MMEDDISSEEADRLYGEAPAEPISEEEEERLIAAAIDPDNRCQFCNGLGYVPAPGDTRDCCGFCDGTGKLEDN